MVTGIPLLAIRGLTYSFPRRGLLQEPRGGARPVLDHADLDVHRGECLALVGESGCGKTTFVRAILRLFEPDQGEVLFQGEDVLAMDRASLLAFRKKAQIVFQDPFGSLNPRLRAGAMLEEVLRVHGKPGSSAELKGRVTDLLGLVGLREYHRHRYPHEFSGGQRQRLCLARALSVQPDLLILDEPVSSLDLSVQAQILNLLEDLRARLSLTVLLVTHDLSVVRQIADRIAVLHAGRVVEVGSVETVFLKPRHDYTRVLLDAADLDVGAVVSPDDLS
jgi:ABC-type glutathione transport system ATPase component